MGREGPRSALRGTPPRAPGLARPKISNWIRDWHFGPPQVVAATAARVAARGRRGH